VAYFFGHSVIVVGVYTDCDEITVKSRPTVSTYFIVSFRQCQNFSVVWCVKNMYIA